MKVSVYLNESYRKGDFTCMLYLRVFINKKYLQIPLDLHIDPDNYNKASNRVTKGVERNTHNHLIKDALGRASNIILKYKVNGKMLTRELFEKEFRMPSTLTEFYAFMEDQIKLRVGEITQTSANQQLTCLNKLKSFKGSCLMSELDENFIREFEKYMRNKLKNNPNTIYNSLKTVRTYVNRAIKLELMQVSPFKYYKLKRVKTSPEF